MEIDLKQLRELMQALREFDLSEVKIQRGEQEIVLKRKPEGAVVTATPAPYLPQVSAFPLPAAPSVAPAEATQEEDANVVFVTSPFVGTFYRSPSPEAPAFVEIGSRIRQGQVLCIIEAMKLMNEIESEVDGEIVEVLVENGKPVEYGDRLFRVRKS